MSITAGAARDLLLYMLWADRQMLKSVRPVDAEHLTRDAGVSFRSLLGTMAHILGGEKLWLSRFLGHPDHFVLGPDDFPDLLSWITAWEENASGVEAFLAGLTDEQLAAPLTWTSLEGVTHTRPLWQPVLQMVNHSTYHRGQVVSLLRQMGYPVASSDLTQFFAER
ncbi:MAG TPA: DinB family protein [Thermoanaerobaculia bacterium]|nr:DinB family protein [Thermoanaerobaculia bacterium]